MVVGEDESEEWEPSLKSKGALEDYSDATLSDGAADQFVIKSRAPLVVDAADKQMVPGRVKQVVQAFEACKMVGNDAEKVGDVVQIDEYGLNVEWMGGGGRKRLWSEAMVDGEESSMVKKQFVEEVEEEMLKSVEEASRKWPQPDK
ncbi:unnamed protein product [Linum trigynum]|uniref:Uncharacterized protein n=1 Tax=Linum trigynum TaxID=586398 RepID=A0AAV2DYW1_9ROSI